MSLRESPCASTRISRVRVYGKTSLRIGLGKSAYRKQMAQMFNRREQGLALFESSNECLVDLSLTENVKYRGSVVRFCSRSSVIVDMRTKWMRGCEAWRIVAPRVGNQGRKKGRSFRKSRPIRPLWSVGLSRD